MLHGRGAICVVAVFWEGLIAWVHRIWKDEEKTRFQEGVGCVLGDG